VICWPGTDAGGYWEIVNKGYCWRSEKIAPQSSGDGTVSVLIRKYSTATTKYLFRCLFPVTGTLY
jgi:hypothetical protein